MTVSKYWILLPILVGGQPGCEGSLSEDEIDEQFAECRENCPDHCNNCVTVLVNVHPSDRSIRRRGQATNLVCALRPCDDFP